MLIIVKIRVVRKLDSIQYVEFNPMQLDFYSWIWLLDWINFNLTNLKLNWMMNLKFWISQKSNLKFCISQKSNTTYI